MSSDSVDTQRHDASAYDYDLPPDSIAQEPATPRDASRLAVLDRRTGALTHAVFCDLPRFLEAGDLLVLNDTRVIPARVRGKRFTGGKIEVFFLRDLGNGRWEALTKCNGYPRTGEWIDFGSGDLRVRLLEKRDDGSWILTVPRGDFLSRLKKVGETPLPPYIRRGETDDRTAADRERYQTIYAEEPGAVAAPTAGLHFTERVFRELEARGIRRTALTLHVGAGTFRPIKAKDIREHRMHAEAYSVSPETAEAIQATRQAGGRVVAVGTTTCRTLETLARDGLAARSGETDIYIAPPYSFGLTDAMLTNFHLPRSSLLVMVSAFAGRERILRVYEECKAKGYRFYSYGDAMLIL